MYIEVKNLKKSYGTSQNPVPVLKGINLSVEKGSMCVIQGSSGSGKSTLLNCIGGLDTIDSGEVTVDDINISELNSKALSDYRRNYLGFVFQFYNLVPNLTIKENICMCSYLSDSPIDLNELISVLGLNEHKDKYPSQVSGGQQQRCAIARALIKNPKILLCEEPTGALDSKTSKEILILLEEINKKYDTTILIVTHNNAIQAMVDKIIVIKDGEIVSDNLNSSKISARLLEDL